MDPNQTNPNLNTVVPNPSPLDVMPPPATPPIDPTLSPVPTTVPTPQVDTPVSVPTFPTPPTVPVSTPMPQPTTSVPEITPTPLPTPAPIPTPPPAPPVEPSPTPIIPTPTASPVATVVSQSEGQGAGKYQVRVIADKCIGAASCVAVAPKAFQLNDEQIAQVLASVNQESDENLLLASQSCPTLAIEVIDTQTGQKVWPK